jgi:hypothetical protein
MNKSLDIYLDNLFEEVESQFPNWESLSDAELSEVIIKAKPFHGYNSKRHSKTGGLNSKFREKYNRETGSNLKAPVTEKNPSGKKAARKRSFCARMSGVKGPTSKDGKLTPKGAALKRWRCSKAFEIYDGLDELAKSEFWTSKVIQQKVAQAIIKAGRCWENYEPTPGKKPYEEGSCRPKKFVKKYKKGKRG